MYAAELRRCAHAATYTFTHWRLVMKRCLSLGSLLAVLVLAVIFTTVPGCPKTPTPVPPKADDGKGGDGKGSDAKGGKGGEALAVKAFDGVVKGKVVIDGTAPA